MKRLFAAALCFAALGFPAFAQEQIDYGAFRSLTEKLEPYREARRIEIDTFKDYAVAPGTIILDARSADAYAMGHIDGAINLPFTDFTADALAAVIPSPDTRILIYCNNNFVDDVMPVVIKAAPLSLNVPTFINLYGYGYENVYELKGAYSFTDPALDWTGTMVEKN